MKPARVLSEAIVGPIVIIMDPLDESGDTDSRRDLLYILGNTENHITVLPPNIRILLTSDIYQTLTQHSTAGRTSGRSPWNTIPPELTKRDIFRYVCSQLSRVDLGSQVRKSSLPLLAHPVKYSSGHDCPVHISGEITMLEQG